MFVRLFGSTEWDQMQYLKFRVPLTVICLVIAIVGEIITPGMSALIGAVFVFVWGWNATMVLFGIVSLSAIFSRNLVLAVILLVFYLLIAYIVGIIVSLLGISRYIFLRFARN